MSARCAHIPHSPLSLFVVLLHPWDSHTQRHTQCSVVQIKTSRCLKAYMCCISCVSSCSLINKYATPAVCIHTSHWTLVLYLSSHSITEMKIFPTGSLCNESSISMFSHAKNKVILKCTHKARVPDQPVFEIVQVTTFKIFYLNSKFWNLLMERGINK